MTKPEFVLEQATPEEATKVFFEWSSAESWNPSRGGYEIERVYLKVDPASFFFGRLKDGNQQKTTVSIISAIHYGDKQGWIGNNICQAAHRGRGYGLKGFLDALATFPAGACVGLDGVMAQVENYKKVGFVHHSWTNERRHGDIDDLIAKAGIDEQKHAAHLVSSPKLLTDSHRAQLGQIEKEASGLDRAALSETWMAFHDGDEHRFGVAYLSEDRQTVLGYGCIRPAVSSYRVGPLYAPSAEISTAILVKLGRLVLEARKQSTLEGVEAIIDIDVPDKNKAAMAFFDGLGWPNIFPCARMWYGPKPPKSNVDHLFAVCTLEVG